MSGLKRSVFTVILAALFCGSLVSQEFRVGRGTLGFGGLMLSGVYWDADDVPLRSDANVQINGDRGYYGETGNIGMRATLTYRAPFQTDDIRTIVSDLFAHWSNGPVGFRIRLRSYGFTTTPINIRYAFGNVNLFYDSMRIKFGYIAYDNVWGSQGDMDWDPNYPGVRVEFRPFSHPLLRDFVRKHSLGLINAGAWFVIPTDKNTNTIIDRNGAEDYHGGDVNLKNVLNETLFGFRWVLPFMYANLAYKLDGTVDNGQILNYDNTEIISFADEEDYLVYGLGFTKFPELKLTTEGQIIGLRNWRVRGRADLHQTVEYKFSRLRNPYLSRIFLGLRVREWLWGYDLSLTANYNIDIKPWIEFKPIVGYEISNMCVAQMEFAYSFGNTFTAVPTRTAQNVAVVDSCIIVKPQFKFNFGNGLSLNCWYKYTMTSYGDLGDETRFANRALTNIPFAADGSLVESIKSHQVAVEIRWGF